jgi:hypothetical protein
LRTFLLSLVALPVVCITVLAQAQRLAEHPAIAYSTTAPADAVARLQKAIDAGETRLEFDAARGYLPSLLKALNIPVSSQGLVFSRTSLQVDRIAPWTPRAIYFSDDVYVGWVQGGPIMEIASVDPKLGAVFYTVTQERSAKPTITRETRSCLMCHESAASTAGVPGLIMRSVVADRHGYPASSARGATTDQTPIGDRWGGWYVTGTVPAPHLGNAMAPALTSEMGNVERYLAKTSIATQGTVTDLGTHFDTAPYLTPHSDAVALLVLAHQTAVHNLITAAGYQARTTPADQPRIEGVAERLVRALLVAREAPLPGAVTGTSGFAEAFATPGPRDRRGRSLRELDLERRVFRYPLSYLIYSESFDALPPPVKIYIYRRLREVLSGADQGPEFAHLSPADRDAIREILADTKPDFIDGQSAAAARVCRPSLNPDRHKARKQHSTKS